jgi:hypothetical protein
MVLVRRWRNERIEEKISDGWNRRYKNGQWNVKLDVLKKNLSAEIN